MTWQDAVNRIGTEITFTYCSDLTGRTESVRGTLKSVWLYTDGEDLRANIQVLKTGSPVALMFKLGELNF